MVGKSEWPLGAEVGREGEASMRIEEASFTSKEVGFGCKEAGFGL